MPPKTTAPGDPDTLEPERDVASPGRPYGGQSPDARRAERRRRILDAALQCYGTAGYPATTIAELCRTASVAPVKFYEEFTGKEELLYVLSTEIMTEAVTLQLDAVSHAPRTLHDRALQGVLAFCHNLLDDPRRARIVLVEGVGVSREGEMLRRQTMRDFATMLQDLLIEFVQFTGGEVPETNRGTRMISLAMVGGIQEALVEWLHEEERQPIDELAEVLAEMLVAVGRASLERTH